MKVYVIENVLYSYDPGMAVIVAPDLARCRELFVAKFFNTEYISTDDYVKEFDASIANGTFKVLESVDAAEGIFLCLRKCFTNIHMPIITGFMFYVLFIYLQYV